MPDAPSPTPSSPETALWKGTTSQWTNFWYYFLCVLLAAGIVVSAVVSAAFTAGLAAAGLVIPAGMAAIRWWVTRCTVYELTNERFRVTSGVLHRRQDELELFRVKDYSVDQPFLLRLLGLGNLTMVTADATTPTVRIKAVRGVFEIRDHLRRAVDAARDRKRVRQMDVDNLDDDFPGGGHGDSDHHA